MQPQCLVSASEISQKWTSARLPSPSFFSPSSCFSVCLFPPCMWSCVFLSLVWASDRKEVRLWGVMGQGLCFHRDDKVSALSTPGLTQIFFYSTNHMCRLLLFLFLLSSPSLPLLSHTLCCDTVADFQRQFSEQRGSISSGLLPLISQQQKKIFPQICMFVPPSPSKEDGQYGYCPKYSVTVLFQNE